MTTLRSSSRTFRRFEKWALLTAASPFGCSRSLRPLRKTSEWFADDVFHLTIMQNTLATHGQSILKTWNKNATQRNTFISHVLAHRVRIGELNLKRKKREECLSYDLITCWHRAQEIFIQLRWTPLRPESGTNFGCGHVSICAPRTLARYHYRPLRIELLSRPVEFLTHFSVATMRLGD